MTAALEGVRVLDLTHHIAGPYCTKLLADFGADVVKVERPAGDPGRRMAPFFHDEADPDKSLPFAYLNTNKRSVTVNLKSGEGREIIRSLAAESDVLVENFSPRVMPSFGLDYESLRRDAPGLVMVSISNFGQTGPYRDYKAADIVEYALGGLMYIFGAYDREPLKHAFHQAQFKAGTDAASAALMALYHQRLTGEGQHVDVSIQEAVASGLRDVVNNYTYTGAVRRRQPNHSGDLQRLRATADGYMLPSPGLGGGDWNTVVEFLGLPELDDEKFSTPFGAAGERRGAGPDTGRLLHHQEQIRDVLLLAPTPLHLRRDPVAGGSAGRPAVRVAWLFRRGGPPGHRAAPVPRRSVQRQRQPLAGGAARALIGTA